MDDLDKAKALHGMMVKGDTFYIIMTPLTENFYSVWRCQIVGDMVEWGRPKRFTHKPCEWLDSMGLPISSYEGKASVDGTLYAGHDAREIMFLALEMNREKYGREWNWPRI
jgi:hypothetical protein